MNGIKNIPFRADDVMLAFSSAQIISRNESGCLTDASSNSSFFVQAGHYDRNIKKPPGMSRLTKRKKNPRYLLTPGIMFTS